MKYEIKATQNPALKKSFAEKQFASIHSDCEELVKLTSSIQFTMKNKLNERKTK